MPDLNLDKKAEPQEQFNELIWQKIWRIDAFKQSFGKTEIKKPEKYLQELKSLATIASIASSTRIEGSKLSDNEVKELIDNLEINKLQTRDQEEVAGYYEALELIHQNYEFISLSEAYIKQIHKTLLEHSSKDTRHKGQYKSLSNKVVAKYPGGQSKIIFNTTEPHLTPIEMMELITWTNLKLKNQSIHSLITIAIFTYEFLSIHPFQDGNGRLSRLLSNLLLIKSEYKFIEYISLEHIIEERKREYYNVLMEGQKNRYSKKENLDLWILFFVECIEIAAERLKSKLENLDAEKKEKQSLQASSTETITNHLAENREKAILNLMGRNNAIKMLDLVTAFPEIPRRTLNLDLNSLISKEQISKHGNGRGTYYKIAKD